MSEKAILVVSFGTSFKDAREKAIRPVEEAIASTYSEYDVKRAFTSIQIRAKLKREGISIDGPEEAVVKLIQKDYKEIIIQPLHILEGFEYEKIKEAIKKATEKIKKSQIRILLGKPLMTSDEDIKEVAKHLRNQIKEVKLDEIVILVGHGTDHRANEVYNKLEQKLTEEGDKIIVGTIEEGVEATLNKLKKYSIKNIILMPFLLVAGDHVMNDIMGESKESWCEQLTESGYNVKVYAKGLGENPFFQQLYVERLRNIIEIKKQTNIAKQRKEQNG